MKARAAAKAAGKDWSGFAYSCRGVPAFPALIAGRPENGYDSTPEEAERRVPLPGAACLRTPDRKRASSTTPYVRGQFGEWQESTGPRGSIRRGLAAAPPSRPPYFGIVSFVGSHISEES